MFTSPGHRRRSSRSIAGRLSRPKPNSPTRHFGRFGGFRAIRLRRNHACRRRRCPQVTEQQRYTVVESRDGVERRHYPQCVVADVSIVGPADKAGNMAFRPLVGYISGANRGSSTLAMTAPVLQEPQETMVEGRSMAMTAPVLQEPAGHDAWVVSFVLPGEGKLADYPRPTDPRVTLREVPAHDAAAIRYSGRWTASNVEAYTGRLMRAVEQAGWSVAGQPRWARYDPPWKPAFARRNEIIVPLAGDGEPTE